LQKDCLHVFPSFGSDVSYIFGSHFMLYSDMHLALSRDPSRCHFDE